jgi:tetratricopeptide (TPR) repeat protein
VRHALRAYTTVIIAEDGIMKSPFFDLSHIVIRTYRHLGEDIGVKEMRRFTAELTGAIKDILAKEPDLRRDSPVYAYLKRLTPPSIREEEAAVRTAAERAVAPSSAPTQPVSSGNAVATAYSEMMRRVDAAQKKGKPGDWLKAKMLLGDMRESRKAKIEERPEGQRTAKLEDPYSAEEALMEARDLLSLLEPHTSNDTETLGLWGSVHKQLWVQTKDRSHLDEAVRSYERGFYLRSDYYNGINFAFLLNVRAANTGDVAEAIADFVQARRVRKEVIEICERWLEANPEPTSSEATEGALQKYQESRYWVLATLAEAYFGLGENEQAEHWQTKAYAIASAEVTQKQLDELRALLANSPLSRISSPGTGGGGY